MARRNGRPGDYLFADMYTGFTKYRTQVRKDFWGSFAERPLLRNLQEIATPLLDPYPVGDYSPGTYEQIDECVLNSTPPFIGKTNIPTPIGPAVQNAGGAVAIPDQEIGCNNWIYGP